MAERGAHSVRTMKAIKLRADMLARPMPPPLLAAAGLAVLVAGAAYCLGYEGLRGGVAGWPGSLLWSACGIGPWFVLFEYAKRREWERDAPLRWGELALLLVAVGLVSILLEGASDWLRGAHRAPLGLQLLRRLPAIGATMLLLLLSRREHRAGAARPAAAPAAEAEALRRQAAAIFWIQAADNYLELHAAGGVSIRRVTMREAAALLGPHGFVRIHRSFIVNRRHVAAVVQGKSGPAVQTLDGALLPTGRAFAANLRTLR